MSFLAIFVALLLEQVRPLMRDNRVYAWLRQWARWVSRNFDAGHHHHGWIVWSLAVLLPAALTLALHWLLLLWVGWPAAVLWGVLVLYLTLGFRQFSHHFTGIRDALENGEEAQARALLARWRQVDASALPRSELVRHVIEYSVLAAHRHVFGVLAWFSVLAAFGLGPSGAVLYRMSEFVARFWAASDALQEPPTSPALQQVCALAWHLIDWPSARLTAVCFAVVGSFEESIEAWRQQNQIDAQDNDAVLLAATAGAVNVRLGSSPPGLHSVLEPGAGWSEAQSGREPEVAHLRSIVGLVWRSVVLWLLLLALLTLARLLG